MDGAVKPVARRIFFFHLCDKLGDGYSGVMCGIGHSNRRSAFLALAIFWLAGVPASAADADACAKVESDEAVRPARG